MSWRQAGASLADPFEAGRGKRASVPAARPKRPRQGGESERAGPAGPGPQGRLVMV